MFQGRKHMFPIRKHMYAAQKHVFPIRKHKISLDENRNTSALVVLYYNKVKMLKLR